jgi:hypothetical protein
MKATQPLHDKGQSLWKRCMKSLPDSLLNK